MMFPDGSHISKPTARTFSLPYPGSRRLIFHETLDLNWTAWLDGIQIGSLERSENAWVAITGSSSQTFGHRRAAANWIATTHAGEAP